MIVVVGGQARKAGKTRAVCAIIAATPEARWTAVKITPHAHEPGVSNNPDTERYLAAGAYAAHLITGSPPLGLPVATNLIIESNRIITQLNPDLMVFIRSNGGQDRKESALAAEQRADFVITGEITPEVIAAVRSRLSAQPLSVRADSPCHQP